MADLYVWKKDMIDDCEKFIAQTGERVFSASEAREFKNFKRTLNKAKLVWKSGGELPGEDMLRLYWLSMIARRMRDEDDEKNK
ncbi:hypothetical protein GOV11_00825 [Candidatus Woesearchaeota archaeon]|nr:hypothetical protein [Candidatus Woesearchaeota archaeon]